MYHFARTDWQKRLDGGFTVWSEGYDVQIDVLSTSRPLNSLKLQTSHIVFGLYTTMVDVAAHSRFCETHTDFFLNRRRVGVLVIEEKAPRTPLRSGGINATGTSIRSGSPQSNAVTYPSGTFNDPDDIGFSVSYTFSGVRVNSKDVFLAILDALATTAQFPQAAPFTSLSAISPSGGCTVRVDAVERMNYSFIIKTLRLVISDIIVPLGKFEEMTLQLKGDDSTVAEGSIKLTDSKSIAR